MREFCTIECSVQFNVNSASDSEWVVLNNKAGACVSFSELAF